MSELNLNLIDAERTLHGPIHGSVADATIAALSAEPETIPELVAALARYIKPLDDSSPFQSFRMAAEIDTEHWDAGIVIIDLTTRIVAIESSYSQPQNEGEVRYHDGEKSTDIPVMYRLPDDWLFVSSVEAYQWSHERRSKERPAKTALDVRKVLYGAPLLDFIIGECGKIEVSPERAMPIDAAANAGGSVADVGGSIPSASGSVADAGGSIEDAEDPLWRELSEIHSRWLMRPREDLRGQSPREVLLAKQDFIDFDLHTRSLQWSLQNEGPPCLSQDSFAYRFAGFGTQEWVIYYDLIRYLLWSAIDKEWRIDSDIARLEEIKSNWLEQPQPDYGGRIPAILIDNERKRLPIALRPRDMIIDEDCPTCQMFGDETSPLGMGVGFWFLDGSHMDDDFVFSSYRTREEWEAENHRREEFNKEFDRKWEERQQRIARGEPIEPDPYFDPEPFDLGPNEPDVLSSNSLDSTSPDVDTDSNEPIQ